MDELQRGERAPVPTPPHAELTIEATLERLRPRLEAAGPAIREAAGRLLLSYAQDPSDGARIAQALEALIPARAKRAPKESREILPAVPGASRAAKKARQA